MRDDLHKEYNMRIFQKKDKYGLINLYMESKGKIWLLKGGDFCGDLTPDYEIVVDSDDYAENFYT